MITYLHMGMKPFAISVRLDGKQVGFIRRDAEGYYYTPRKGHRSETFPSIEAVKASLETA